MSQKTPEKESDLRNSNQNQTISVVRTEKERDEEIQKIIQQIRVGIDESLTTLLNQWFSTQQKIVQRHIQTLNREKETLLLQKEKLQNDKEKVLANLSSSLPSPLSNWEQSKRSLSTLPSLMNTCFPGTENIIVQLNVGGKYLSTTKKILCSVPGSYLDIMFRSITSTPTPSTFSNQSSEINQNNTTLASPPSLNDFPSLNQDSSGRYFLDRDGEIFSYVLESLRSYHNNKNNNDQQTQNQTTTTTTTTKTTTTTTTTTENSSDSNSSSSPVDDSNISISSEQRSQEKVILPVYLTPSVTPFLQERIIYEFRYFHLPSPTFLLTSAPSTTQINTPLTSISTPQLQYTTPTINLSSVTYDARPSEVIIDLSDLSRYNHLSSSFDPYTPSNTSPPSPNSSTPSSLSSSYSCSSLTSIENRAQTSSMRRTSSHTTFLKNVDSQQQQQYQKYQQQQQQQQQQHQQPQPQLQSQHSRAPQYQLHYINPSHITSQRLNRPTSLPSSSPSPSSLTLLTSLSSSSSSSQIRQSNSLQSSVDREFNELIESLIQQDQNDKSFN